MKKQEMYPVGADISNGCYYTVIGDRLFSTPLPNNLILKKKKGRYVVSSYRTGDYPVMVSQLTII